MNDVGYVAGWVLAVTFARAAAGKWRDRDATARAFSGLGLPRPSVLAAGVPATEAALAVGLVMGPRVAAALSLAVLGAFTVVIVRAVRARSSVACGCFGSSASRPASVVDAVRNLFLAGLAVAALAVSQPVVPGLDAVMLVSLSSMIGLVVLSSLRLRLDVGRLWSTRLAGEPG